MRVPNFWAAAAAGSCDSVIFDTFYIENRGEQIIRVMKDNSMNDLFDSQSRHRWIEMKPRGEPM